MGALKGRFQCLRGLRVNINCKDEHVAACRWITIAIILHNLIIDVEGGRFAAYFMEDHGHGEEQEDHGGEEQPFDGMDDQDGEVKRRLLVAELIAAEEL